MSTQSEAQNDAAPMPTRDGAAEAKHDDGAFVSDEDADDEVLIEPITILKLLHGFCGDGEEVPDAAQREKAGQLVWDLSASRAHAAVIGPHAPTLLDAATADGASDRVAEVALGIFTNVCGWCPELCKSEAARELVTRALLSSEDPGLLTESLRLVQTCFLVLREDRHRDALLKPFADAWAATAIAFKKRILFCIENSLDARLVARALELAFTARFFPNADGDCDVFHALCAADALLRAALDALRDVGGEDLHATPVDEHGDGLDSALRVVELCSVRPREIRKEDLVRRLEGDAEVRARAVQVLRDVYVSDPDAVPRDVATASVALANFGADTTELSSARSPARLVRGLCTALETALDTGPEETGDVNPAAAAAAFLLRAVFAPNADNRADGGPGIVLGAAPLARLGAALGRAKAVGLEIPKLQQGEVN